MANGAYQEKVRGAPTGRWIAEIVRDGKRHRARFDTEAQAQAQVRRWKKQGPDIIKPERLTLQQALEQAAEIMWLRDEWRASMLSGVGRLIKVMGNPMVSDVTKARIEDAQGRFQREEKLATSTVVKYLAGLMQLLRWAEDRGHIDRVPKIKYPAFNNEKTRWLHKEEEVQLLAALRSYGNEGADEVADYIRVSILTGCRGGELRSAKRSQVDSDWLRLWDTKTGKPRSVPLTPEAKEILLRRLPFNLTKRKIGYWWEKAKADIGLAHDEELTPHTTRHTTATRLLRQRGDLRLVQKYLGHTRISTTERYAHLHQNDLLEAANLLD